MTLATWWEQITPGTAYWRCLIPARHLPGKVCDLQFADLAPDGRGEPHMPRQEGGCAIWQYSGSKTRGALMSWQQEQGLRVLLEVDDNYLSPSDGKATPGWCKTDAEASGVDHSTHEMHARCAAWVDGVVCATRPLADAYRRVNPNVFVCPNSVDPDDWAALDKPNDGVFRIGWAASGSHMMDAHLVRRAFQWASRQDGVEVWFLGTPPSDWKFRLHNVPWTRDLAAYRLSLQSLDVGVCALTDTTWTRSKSDVKCLEYSMAGALSICSNVPAYEPWKGGPCLWASSATDFERAIRWCVFHRDEVKEIARAAREHVLAERTIGKSIHLWREAVAA